MGLTEGEMKSKIDKRERNIRLLDVAKWTMWGIYNIAMILLLTKPGLTQSIGAGMFAGQVGIIIGKISTGK